MDESLSVNIEGGILKAMPSTDPEYPGIIVEFIANDDAGCNASRPTVMMEKPEYGDLRVLVWENKDDEDYTQDIGFC